MPNDPGSIINGFRFQIDSAIYIFIKELKNIQKLGVEKSDDIQIVFNTGEITYVQSKSVADVNKTDASSKKLRDALVTLLNHKESNIKELWYGTNQKNPITKKKSSFKNNEVQIIHVEDLTQEEKKTITRYIDIKTPISKKVYIFKLPYEANSDLYQTRKHILEEIENKLILMKVNPNIQYGLINSWHNLLENSATMHEFVDKKRFTWLIIAELLNKKIDNYDSDFKQSKRIKMLFDSIINDFQVVNLVKSLYVEYTKSKKFTNSSSFIHDNFVELSKIVFSTEEITTVIKEDLHLIVQNMIEIDNDITNTKKEAGIVWELLVYM